MNDVRKLMGTLRGEVEYREFGAPAAAAQRNGWALLDRVSRATPKPSAVVVEPVVAEAPPPAPDPEPALATQMRQAAVARSSRGMGSLKLGKYTAAAAPQAPAASAEDARKLPLEAVFARLAQGAR